MGMFEILPSAVLRGFGPDDWMHPRLRTQGLGRFGAWAASLQLMGTVHSFRGRTLPFVCFVCVFCFAMLFVNL